MSKSTYILRIAALRIRPPAPFTQEVFCFARSFKPPRHRGRRSVRAGVGVRAAGPASTEPDPIFASIEAHRRAYTEYLAAVNHEFAIEEEIPYDRRRSSIAVWEEEIIETDDPQWIAAIRGTDETDNATFDAAGDRVGLKPTTIAGAVALLNYYAAGQGDDYSSFPVALLDEDDPAITRKEAGAPFGYFIARNVADALRTLQTA